MKARQIPKVMKKKEVEELFKSIGATILDGKIHLGGRSATIPSYAEIDSNRLGGIIRSLGITRSALTVG